MSSSVHGDCGAGSWNSVKLCQGAKLSTTRQHGRGLIISLLCVCVCVCEYVCVCVCECVRERENVCVCVCECVRERENVCLCPVQTVSKCACVIH